MTLSEFIDLPGSDFDIVFEYLKIVLGYDPIVYDINPFKFDFYDNCKIKITSCYWEDPDVYRNYTEITNYILIKKLDLLTKDKLIKFEEN